MAINHAFVSSAPEGSDTSKVRTSSWNANLVVTGGALGSLLYRDTGNSDGHSWLADVATGSVLVSGGVGVAPAWSATPTLTSVLFGDGSVGTPSRRYSGDTDLGSYRIGADNEGFSAAGVLRWDYNTTRLNLSSGYGIQFNSGAGLYDGGANIVAQRNGTNAQRWLIYKTYTDASNYEVFTIGLNGYLEWDLLSAFAGTGAARNVNLRASSANLVLQTGWNVGAGNHITTTTTNVYDLGSSAATVRTGYFGTSVLVSGSGGVGYATGAGGTVTQATSKATGVTLNTVTGQITMHNAALAAGAKVSYVVTDSAFAAVDTAIVSVTSGGTANAYRADVTAGAAGSFTITVENITAGSLSEAPVITFAIIKGATS